MTESYTVNQIKTEIKFTNNILEIDESYIDEIDKFILKLIS